MVMLCRQVTATAGAVTAFGEGKRLLQMMYKPEGKGQPTLLGSGNGNQAELQALPDWMSVKLLWSTMP